MCDAPWCVDIHDQSVVIEPNVPENFHKCVPKVTFYIGVGHYNHNQVHY
jgi:hypothetical protein